MDIGERLFMILGLLAPPVLTVLVAMIRSRRREPDAPIISNIQGAA
jgi:hypothetical protein